LDLHYKIHADSNHVAKFQGDRSRELGERVAKKKKKKHHEHFISPPVTTVNGRPNTFVDFGTNRKRVFDFLLVINGNLCRISHRFRDTAAYWSKIANLYPPHPHSTPSLGVTPFEFWDDRDIPRNYNDGVTI